MIIKKFEVSFNVLLIYLNTNFFYLKKNIYFFNILNIKVVVIFLVDPFLTIYYITIKNCL